MATPARSLGPQDVVVRITTDSSGAIKVSPDQFAISKGRNQEVVWVCENPAGFTVEFNKANGSPFHGSLFTNQSPCSGHARGDVAPDPTKVYGYTVTVGGKTLDPGGVVNP